MGWEHREVTIAPQETGITASRACQVIPVRDHTIGVIQLLVSIEVLKPRISCEEKFISQE